MKTTCKFTLDATLPAYPAFEDGIRRAPDRGYCLTQAQTRMHSATYRKNSMQRSHPSFSKSSKSVVRSMLIAIVPRGISRLDLSIVTKVSASRVKHFR